MVQRLPSLLVFLCAPLVADAGSLYKCEAADGSVSFQDQPCAGGQTEERRDSAVASGTPTDLDFEPVVLVIPGVGQAVVPVFDTMEYLVRRDGNEATTIAIRTRQGEPPMDLQITFVPNRLDNPYSDTDIGDILRDLHPALAPPIATLGAEQWSFETQIGTASMATETDQHFGEWDTVTFGIVIHSNVVAAVRIFNNGGASESLKSALKVVNAFHVAGSDGVLR